MCVRDYYNTGFYINFIKINKENKAIAIGQQFTWPHHYIQMLAPQITRPHYYRPTIYLAIPLYTNVGPTNYQATLLPANNLPGHTTIGHYLPGLTA